MRSRSAIALTGVLTSITASLVASPAEGRPAGPTGVRTTMVLLRSSEHRVVSTGHAPPGSRVVLQNRFDKHQAFGTVRSGTTAASGRFTLTADLRGEAYGKYRVCVVGSRTVCAAPARPTVRKRHGRIAVTSAPAQVVPEEPSAVNGHVTKFLRSSVIRLQYQDSSRKWVTVASGGGPTGYVQLGTYGLTPNIGIGPASPALKLRLHALPTRDVAAASSKSFTVPVYGYHPLGGLPVTSGALVATTVNVYYGPSVGTAPAGTASVNSASLALPQGCGRVVFGVVIDRLLVQPADTYSASLAVDGTTIWSHAPGDPLDMTEHQITLPPNSRELTLTTSYDATEPDRRPWFVDPNGSNFTPNAAAHVLCTS